VTFVSLPDIKQALQVYDWAAIAEACRKRWAEGSSDWYHVADDVVRSRKTAIEQGKYPAFREGMWEVVTRASAVTADTPARGAMFIRYLGPDV
jgi:hypothetical protein